MQSTIRGETNTRKDEPMLVFDAQLGPDLAPDHVDGVRGLELHGDDPVVPARDRDLELDPSVAAHKPRCGHCRRVVDGHPALSCPRVEPTRLRLLLLVLGCSWMEC